MKIFKKLGFVVLYYLLASLIDQIFVMFFANTFISFLLTAFSICTISCYLRKAEIIKRNYLQEQRDKYNESFKTKFNHIISQLDFKVEIVIGAISCIILGVIPRIAMGACYFFLEMYAYCRAWCILIYVPLFVLADFFIWYFAYHSSFKKKKY